MSLEEKISKRVKERNSWKTYETIAFSKVCKLLSCNAHKMVFGFGLPSQQEIDEVFPVKDIDWGKLRTPSKDGLIQSTWIGHASVFCQLPIDGKGQFKNILTDPLFSERCSAIQLVGPRRYRPTPCTIDDFYSNGVPIDIVLISHNHYDHLDFNSVVKLNECSIKAKKPIEFIVPLGLKKWFQKYVPTAEKVTELDWHGQFCSDDVTVTALPMQHWSSRYGYDKDKTLWCGFQVKTKSKNLLFCGDTGYFKEAAERIGNTYGPFDFALIPIGAYEPRWFMINQHCK